VEAAYAKAPTGPHLIVTSVKAAPDERKPFHRFVRGRPFELVVKVKNTGTASVTRKGLHEGVVLLKPNGGLKFVEETHFDFPRLGAGKTAAVDVLATGLGFDGRDGGPPQFREHACRCAVTPISTIRGL